MSTSASHDDEEIEDWHAKLSGLPSVLTDKIRFKLYKRYKKQTGNEPWQLSEAVIDMSAEPCFSASGQASDFKPITFEARPDPELIIKSVLKHFPYLKFRNSFREIDNYNFASPQPWSSPCPICDGKHGNYGLHGSWYCENGNQFPYDSELGIDYNSARKCEKDRKDLEPKMTGGHSINITASTFSGSALGIGPVTGTFGASPTKRVSLVDTVFLNQMTGIDLSSCHADEEEYIERSQGARSIVASAPILNDIQRKRPAEDASPVITSPLNLRDREQTPEEYDAGKRNFQKLLPDETISQDEENPPKIKESVNGVEDVEESHVENSQGFHTPDHNKKTRTNISNLSFDEYTNSINSVNLQDENEEIAESSEDIEDENNEEIKFDLPDISLEFQRKPTVKWEVGDINITNRFREYQKDVLRKAERGGLYYKDIYELLALSSIIVICWPCPYRIFTNQEWLEIIKTNPYTNENTSFSQEISASLHEASCENFIGEEVFINGGKMALNKRVATSFNDLCSGLSAGLSKIIEKTTEKEHCYKFLYPITKPFFVNPLKEYKVVLNRATAGSRKRPDLSCVVDNVTILNSEIKPLRCTPLQMQKDFLKAHLRAREWIESYIMDLKCDGLYRSWSFLTTKLVIDKASIPLAEYAIGHVIALEICGAY
ncbi:hypothetical protein C1645_871261 [Glomus cerebriforme]|uniref:Uncharacterized protein n=1 Tax=Glomus cerebriforme TaxID=658196 RepID=A0A397TRW5_9GLOM|nr:hypothetical protein C1645_871261 [Glomus cerebriforme]